MFAIRSISLVTASAAAMLLVGPALAQQNPTPAQTQPAEVQTLRPSLVHADRLIGQTVVNDQGRRLGTIQDIVLDEPGTAVSYVVLNHGGTAGVGNKLFAVPWRSLRVMPNHQVTLNVSDVMLKKAPGFDKNAWPSAPQDFFIEQGPNAATNPAPGSEQWWNQQLGVERGAGGEPQVFTQPPQQAVPPAVARQQPAPPQVDRKFVSANVWTRRVSKIIGTELRDQQNKNIGLIHDVVIAEPTGQVRFAILTTGGFLGVAPKYVTLPWNALQLNPAQSTASIEMNRQQVLAMAVPANRMPDLNNPAVASRIESQFAQPAGMGAGGANQALGFVGGASAGAAAWQAGSAYNRLFNPSELSTVSGTVTGLDYFRPTPGAADGVRVHLATPQGSVVAYVGPTEFLSRRGVSFEPGEAVTLTGSRATVFGEPGMMVSRIEAGGRTVDLYTPRGEPMFLERGNGVQQTQPGERR